MSHPRVTDPDAVEDLIEKWHDGAGGDVLLHEFLGWTPDEYSKYIYSGETPAPNDDWEDGMDGIARAARDQHEQRCRGH